jgi:hypothetical protein
MGTDFKSVPLPVLFIGFARHGLVEFMTAAFTSKKDAAFPDAHHAPEIKLRPLLSAFRAGEVFEPGGGIGIRKLIQSVFGADGEIVPAAGAHGRVDILSVRAFRLDADEKILFATDGTGDFAQPLLYDLWSDHPSPWLEA